MSFGRRLPAREPPPAYRYAGYCRVGGCWNSWMVLFRNGTHSP